MLRLWGVLESNNFLTILSFSCWADNKTHTHILNFQSKLEYVRVTEFYVCRVYKMANPRRYLPKFSSSARVQLSTCRLLHVFSTVTLRSTRGLWAVCSAADVASSFRKRRLPQRWTIAAVQIDSAVDIQHPVRVHFINIVVRRQG